MTENEVHCYEGSEALATAAVGRWERLLMEGVSEKSPFLVAFSGGRIARHFFSALACRMRNRPGLWEGVHFFWADERCVPLRDPESNYLIASELLFREVKVDPVRIHRIQGELDPVQGAWLASEELRGTAPPNAAGDPVLDLVILGMGEDGHIASLFPGDQVVQERKEPYWPVHAPKPPSARVTLTYNALLACRQVFVLVSGEGKATTLRRCLGGDQSLPLGKLWAGRSKILVLNDLCIGEVG